MQAAQTAQPIGYTKNLFLTTAFAIFASIIAATIAESVPQFKRIATKMAECNCVELDSDAAVEVAAKFCLIFLSTAGTIERYRRKDVHTPSILPGRNRQPLVLLPTAVEVSDAESTNTTHTTPTTEE